MTPEQERKLNEMWELTKRLQSSSTIPLPIDQAFRGRFSLVKTSSKSSSSENKSVNESGGSTYNVLNAPDAFVQVTVDGTIYYLPAYT